ncbi:hypothetical protein C8T65DRAFT_744787 [Cerioporus squamosus]|nr:hypothetical protein C8T65DRAFT_744787 [Cerioporus squamosus]
MPGSFNATLAGKLISLRGVRNADSPLADGKGQIRHGIKCWECHRLSLGMGVCVHLAGADSDDDAASHADSGDVVMEGTTHQITPEDVHDYDFEGTGPYVAIGPRIYPSSVQAPTNIGAPMPPAPTITRGQQAVAQAQITAAPVAAQPYVAVTQVQRAVQTAAARVQPATAAVQPVLQPAAAAVELVVQPTVQPAAVQPATVQPAAAQPAAVQPAAAQPAGAQRRPHNVTGAQVAAILAEQNIVAHYDANDPMFTGKWYVVTRGKTVGVFRNQGTANATTNGFGGQNWFRVKPYESALDAFYQGKATRVRSKQRAVSSSSCLTIPAAARSRAACYTPISWSLGHDEGPDLGLRSPPYTFRVAIAEVDTLAAVQGNGNYPLELKLHTLQSWWLLEDGSARFTEWSAPDADEAHIMERANAELEARIQAWNAVAGKEDADGLEEAREVYLDWGAKRMVGLAQELDIWQMGVEAYIAAQAKKELPFQLLHRANREYVENLPVSEESEVEDDDLFSEKYA